MDSEENTIDNNDDVVEDAGKVDDITLEELLISLVQIRPPLWNSRLPVKERSKTIRDKLWLEIYKELGEQEQYSVTILIKKWRNLRDTYVRLKGEHESYTQSGAEAKKKKKKWQFFDIMSFLNDSLEYRPYVSTISHLTNTTEYAASSPSPTPSESVTLKRRLKCNSTSSTEEAIIGALNRINTPVEITPQETQPINPICMRISQLLADMPARERTVLEIKLLQMAYDGSANYL